MLNKKYWPCKISLPREYNQDSAYGWVDPRMLWLRENMPESENFRWMIIPAGNERTYWFRKEEDLMWFALHWGG